MKHPLADQAAQITEDVIGAAIEVHRDKGPGLLESIYQRCLIHELHLRGHATEVRKTVQVRYKDLVFEEILRCDVIVDGCLLIELKSVAEILPVHKAQTISYIKLLDLPRGLLINFNVPQLIQGLHRVKHPACD
jgi:GxxExxY protein